MFQCPGLGCACRGQAVPRPLDRVSPGGMGHATLFSLTHTPGHLPVLLSWVASVSELPAWV